VYVHYEWWSAHNQQCSALCHICSSTVWKYYIFSAIFTMYKSRSKSWCCLLLFSFMHLPPHLTIAVHKIVLHFSLLPSIFNSFMECIVPILYMLNVTELNLNLFWAGLWNTSTSNLHCLTLICRDQWDITAYASSADKWIMHDRGRDIFRWSFTVKKVLNSQ